MVSVAIAFLFKTLGILNSKGVFGKLVSVIIIIGIIILLFNSAPLLEPYLLDMVDISNFNQQIYNNDADGASSFEFGEIETSVAGLVSNIPISLYTCYFRPHLWEMNKPILLLSALESFFCLLSLIYIMLSNRSAFVTVYKSSLFIRISLFYILTLGILIGLTTFNFGTLVRYKTVSTLFLWLFIVLLLNHKKRPSGYSI
jgi:hypothetical protein